MVFCSFVGWLVFVFVVILVSVCVFVCVCVCLCVLLQMSCSVTEYGGVGLDYTYSMAVAEELGSINCGGVPMAIGVQTDMTTPALARCTHLRSV